MSDVQGPFRADLVWQALMDMLVDGLVVSRGSDNACDVQPVSENDFQGDALIMTPPSVRVFFAEATGDPMSDSQRLSYNAVERFVALCGDQDAGDRSRQALVSLSLAGDVIEILAGARIVLSSDEVSEPVRWLSTSPMPVAGLGTVYAVAFEVPGLAIYPGINAQPEVS